MDHDRQRQREKNKERKAERDRREYDRDEKDVEQDSKELDVGQRKRKPFPSANLAGAEAHQGGHPEIHGINSASASSYDNKDALKSKFLQIRSNKLIISGQYGSFVALHPLFIIRSLECNFVALKCVPLQIHYLLNPPVA